MVHRLDTTQTLLVNDTKDIQATLTGINATLGSIARYLFQPQALPPPPPAAHQQLIEYSNTTPSHTNAVPSNAANPNSNLTHE